jgi:hypothetical protein
MLMYREARISLRVCARRCVNALGLFGGAFLFAAALGMSPSAYPVDRAVGRIAAPVATKATCGQNDRPETGVQGDTSIKDRFLSGPPRAFNCNLNLVGHATGEGADDGMAITGRCMYFDQFVPPNMPNLLRHPGLVVVDAADPEHLKIVNYLTPPGVLSPSQALSIDRKRHLLIVQNSNDLRITSAFTTDIYDVSDCVKPVLKFSGYIPRFAFHTGSFSPDGMTFWAGSGPDEAINAVSALDVSDPSHPKLIAQWHPKDPNLRYLHNVSLSESGNTAYVSLGATGNRGLRTSGVAASSWRDKFKKATHEGVVLLDVSEVQARKPDAKIRKISSLFWNDVIGPQFAQEMIIRGHKYLWANDLDGALSIFAVAPVGRTLTPGPESMKGYADPDASSPVACRAFPKRPGWGYVSIIDIQDRAHPVRVSGLRDEVDEPKYCALTASEPRFAYGYDPLDCDVDNYKDAKMMVCGFSEGGVRVFDIRDVKHPREIAYYKPPATGCAPRAGSLFQAYLDTSGLPGARFHSTDDGEYPLFAKGGKEIWFVSFDNGAQVLRFSDEFMKRHKDLFAR